MRDPIILYRESEMGPGEMDAMMDHFECTKLRAKIPPESLVIGRYAVLPFYAEQAAEVQAHDAVLVNSVSEHNYVADLGAWALDLDDFTFPTWDSLESVPKTAGPFVLKGATNSMKHLWKTHMFAQTWEDAVHVYGLLMRDALISTQKIYIRKYVPLETLGHTLTGLPITYEFRVFVLWGQIVHTSFYWGSFAEDLGNKVPDGADLPMSWLGEAIERVRHRVSFFTIDIARDVTGRWWVVELNDGQMAGLNGGDAESFYESLARVAGNPPV